jgi:hypothetical protein
MHQQLVSGQQPALLVDRRSQILGVQPGVEQPQVHGWVRQHAPSSAHHMQCAVLYIAAAHGTSALAVDNAETQPVHPWL